MTGNLHIVIDSSLQNSFKAVGVGSGGKLKKKIGSNLGGLQGLLQDEKRKACCTYFLANLMKRKKKTRSRPLNCSINKGQVSIYCHALLRMN